MPQCKGKTCKGIRCKRVFSNVKEEYCYLHIHQKNDVSSSDSYRDFKSENSSNIPKTSSDINSISDNDIGNVDSLDPRPNIIHRIYGLPKRDMHILSNRFDIMYHQDYTKIFGNIKGTTKVLGDGRCFWRSISHCVFYSQEHYDSFIKKCMESKQKDEIISEKWVEFWEIPLIAKYLKRKINVYHVMENQICLFECDADGKSDSKVLTSKINPKMGEIHISYIQSPGNGNVKMGHYDPIVY